MKNRALLNLALLVVVAGLGATVWLSQEKEETGPPLTPLRQDAISRIALEHPDAPTIRLEKRDGAWHLSEPVQAPTDKFEVGGILSLAETEVQKTLEPDADLKQLELDPPVYRVTLDDTRIDIGGTEPIQYRRYVKTGDRVVLVNDPPSAALDADFSDLISKSVVPEGRQLQRIELPGELLLEKDADGQWHSPQQGEAGAAQLAQLATAWQDAKAMWNAADPPEGSRGDTVTLELDDGSRIELVVQAREPQLVLARKDYRVRYTLSKALVEELFQIPEPPPAITADADAVEETSDSPTDPTLPETATPAH